VSFVHIFVRIIKDKFRIIFVERVVGEMNIATAQVFICRLLVGFCCKPCQTFMVNV